LRALVSHHILETPPEESFDALTRKAAALSGTPSAFLSLVDENREWFKAVHGLPLKEAPREYSFCAFAIMHPADLMEVPDARYDERFHDNPLTTGGPRIVYYAGVPVVDEQGYALGVLAVVDSRPRQLSEAKLEALQLLATLASSQLRLRKMQAIH
jgi:GAF domain-containing protein